MYRRYPESSYGRGHKRTTQLGRQMNTPVNTQMKSVRGKVFSTTHWVSFMGNETLELSIIGTSLAGEPNVLIGRQKIQLKSRQSFPIPFQFYYDKSRASQMDYGSITMNAIILNGHGALIYTNDTPTPLKHYTEIDVRRLNLPRYKLLSIKAQTISSVLYNKIN